MKELTVEARLESLSKVTAFVDAELEAAGCPIDTQLQFHIVIDEVFGNISHYAYPDGPGEAVIRFSLEESPPTLVLTFLDAGIPFDPLKTEAPDTSLKARERKVGGLGIFMVKKLMDEVRYDFIDGRNVLTLRKGLRATP